MNWTNSTFQSYLKNLEPEVEAIVDETSNNCTHVITAVFTMIMTLGLIGNTKVLSHIIWNNRNTNRRSSRHELPSFARKKIKMNTMTTTFIFNLAAADLCLMLILSILILRMFTGRWMLGHLACKVYLTLDGVTKFVSVAFIVLLSMDRYLAVCQPLRAHSFRTKPVAFCLASMSWIVVCMLMVPVAIFGRLISSGKSFDDEGNVDSSASNVQCAVYFEPNFSEIVDYYSSLTNSSKFDFIDDKDFNDFDTINISTTKSIINLPYLPVIEHLSWNQIFILYNFIFNYVLPLLLIWTFYIQIIFRLRRRVIPKVLIDSKQQSVQRTSNNRLGDMKNGGKSEAESSLLEVSAMINNELSVSVINESPDPLQYSPGQKPNNGRCRQMHHNRRLTTIILLIILTYTICWLPYWILQLGILFKHEMFDFFGQYLKIFIMAAYALQNINSALNPYFYLFSIKRQKNANNDYATRNKRRKIDSLSSVVTRRRFNLL